MTRSILTIAAIVAAGLLVAPASAQIQIEITTQPAAEPATQAPSPAEGTRGIRAGTGQATGQGELDVAAMARQAAEEARLAYGAGTPKVILLAENISAGDEAKGRAILDAVRAVFGQDVPLAGVKITWPDYTPYTLEQFPDNQDIKSIAVMALGGEAIRIQVALGEANLGSNENAAAVEAGANLARNLNPVAGQRNLLLIMGPMHTPLNEGVDEGIQSVWGDPLPDHIRNLGWATSYWGGAAYHNGEFTPSGAALVGVLISGDFDWAFRGLRHRQWGGKSAADIAQFTEQIIGELGGKPDATFIVLGHPPRADWNAIRDGLAKILGDNAPVFGYHAGAETGHLNTNEGSTAAAGTFFMGAIRAK